VHEQPVESFRCHSPSLRVPASPAQRGVGQRESGGNRADEHVDDLAGGPDVVAAYLRDFLAVSGGWSKIVDTVSRR
jgi:hypothetical protein